MDSVSYKQGYGAVMALQEKRAAKIPVRPVWKTIRRWTRQFPLRHPWATGFGGVAVPTMGYLSIPPTAKYPKELRSDLKHDSPFGNETLDNAAAALKHLYVDGPNSKLVSGVTAGLVLGIPAAIAGYKLLKEHGSSSRERELRRQMAAMGYRL